jgi:anthranilate synthase component II
VSKILILDNYDSFTYNLVHIVRALGYAFEVHRNDKIPIDEVSRFDKIILSPGPGIPDEAGIMKEVIRTYGPTKPVLGVCLGHQGIAEVYGAKLFNIPRVLHGVTSMISIADEKEKIFENVSPVFQACHYHSWAVLRESIPDDLLVTATNDAGLVMAIRHRKFNIRGVQFHPESVMTAEGKTIMKNWLSL